MFPSSRRKSASVETAEPSSPKVTCIGQVKIKSSKKSNKNKNLVNRSRSGREMSSFRRREAKAVSICDALSCFMPTSCGGWNSCYGNNNGSGKKEHKRCSVEKRGKSYSCGAVFVRWLMAVEDEEEEKEVSNLTDFNEVGLFVREREADIDFESAFMRREDKFVVFKEEEVECEEEDEEARVSVCIPPKNALLLMRCRSDPVRMAALSTRFWDSPAMKFDCKEEEKVFCNEEVKVDCKEEEEVEVEEKAKISDVHVEEDKSDEAEVEKGVVIDENVNNEEEKNVVAEEKVVVEEVEDNLEIVKGRKDVQEAEEKEYKEEVLHCAEKEKDGREDVEIILRRSISCSMPKSSELLKLKDGAKRRSASYREKEKRRHSFSVEKEARRHSLCSKKEARRSSFSGDNEGSRKGWSFSIEKKDLSATEKKQLVVPTVDKTKEEDAPPLKEEETKVVDQPKFEACKKEETQIVEKEKKPRELPECLLLMMYEPKLSMEVSKETWVCSTDFVHWRPNQQPKHKPETRVDEESEKVEDTLVENKNTVAVVHQIPSKPQAIISPIEQNLLKSLAVSGLPQTHHFVLTRCKSEPGKSSARLVPDTCFWKARHQPIGTAGLGF